MSEQLAKKWSITYLVELDDPVGSSIGSVRVLGAIDSDDPSEVQDLADQKTTLPVGSGSAWAVESTVFAGDDAAVRVRPPATVRAACHVLIDGRREIAVARASQRGQSVTCSAKTPR